MKNDSILVIDDEPNNYEVIETLLAGENYAVYYANSGAEGLAGLEAFNPDVILLDLTMPIMDGLEVCQRLKLMRKWKSVPIIMVTASSSKEVLANCLAAGADDFISKPVNKIELGSRIKSMLRIKKQFDRIESLTKLQQQNITGLGNDLGELGCDLAVGFANELNTPLRITIERLTDIEQNIDRLDRAAVLDLVQSANRSAMELEQMTYKCLIYLELALEKKQFFNDNFCNIVALIESISIVKSRFKNREDDVDLDLENATVAVTNQHCEWIIKELLDRGFRLSNPGTKLTIRSRVIDRQFHLWVSHPQSASLIDNLSIVREDRSPEELELSLKIVKKIVEIYDGLFSLSTIVSIGVASTCAEATPDANCHHSTIYITLPLAVAACNHKQP